MNITVTDQEQCKKQLRLEIPADTVRAETNKIAANLGRQISVPGFRRGHVPPSVIKTRFRKELRDEMLSKLLPHALNNAIREKDLKVLGEPSIDDLKFGDDESIDVTFTIEVMPEFEISNYKNLPIRKRVYKIRDEDVEKSLDRLRERHGELVPVEDRPAQVGDILTANIHGVFVPSDNESRAAETQEAETQSYAEAQSDTAEATKDEEVNQQDVEVELGGQGVLKEFTEALAGARPGDVRTFSVEYPSDYAAKQYAGRKLDYTVEVTAVRVKELPEADDEFAQSVGEEFESIDELRSDIRSKLEEQAKSKSEEELRSAVMDQLIDRNRFDVPEVVIEKQMDYRLDMLARQFSSQGIDPRRLKLDWEAVRESGREQAERESRWGFILDRIGQEEKIEVSEEELDKEIEHLAEHSEQTAPALKARLTKEGALDRIREQIRNRKALEFIIASADIREEVVEGLGKEDAAGSGQSRQAEG